MTIIDSILDFNHSDVFFRLKGFVGQANVFLKLEGLNMAGSIKFKTALRMINGLERKGIIKPGRNRIIESSSGNLGIALSIVCKIKGYEFTCVVDPNASASSCRLIRLYGGNIIRVDTKDENGGYLGTRIGRIKEILQREPTCVWTNQYANLDNPLAHFELTAREIYDHFPDLDYLFVGAGTTGTLVGCASFFGQYSSHTKVIAVDPIGSVTFGQDASKRLIPGLGTSKTPPIFNRENISDVVFVSEEDTINMCKVVLDTYQLLIGPSTGTVLSAAAQYKAHFNENHNVVVISPDFGDKYLDTVYDEEWVAENY
ncbi:MAG: 2,3-diaminopropionate biosynthesis protein SbnA [Proteobacteria bacterium]|nr:2,3-diaminopropionate biosynthesis protein SbnA [Pseudomonadota bacterium]